MTWQPGDTVAVPLYGAAAAVGVVEGREPRPEGMSPGDDLYVVRFPSGHTARLTDGELRDVELT